MTTNGGTKRGRPPAGKAKLQRLTVFVEPGMERLFYDLGNGSVSLGVRRMVRQYMHLDEMDVRGWLLTSPAGPVPRRRHQ